MANPVIKLAVLISGNGSNLQSIIDQIQIGKLDAQIVCVISNQADAYGLQRANEHNIPAHAVEHSSFKSKTEFETALLEALKPYQPELIILAGFMRILSANFVSHYSDRILNIHPSLLPKYKGLDTHARALEAGDQRHGATVHLVTRELDSGEILIQDSCEVSCDDEIESLQQKVHQIEHVIYPQAIRQYAKRLKG